MIDSIPPAATANTTATPSEDIVGPQTAKFGNVKPVVLMEVSSMFPFDFFPSRIRVSTLSVAVVNTFFVGSKETSTLMIDDIFNVDLISTPFFSTLHLTNRQPMMPLVEIKFLRKNDGVKVKNLIQGLMLMKAQKADLSKYSAEQICDQISSLGAVAAT